MIPSSNGGFWWLLLLALAPLECLHSIQVATDSDLRHDINSTESGTAYSDNLTLVGDSELSASERNRRLIPYMAFYLPAPEFPINQQYVVQRPKQQHQSITNSQHSDSAGPLPPSVAIPIPTAYVHMKVPAAETGATLQFQQQQQQLQKQATRQHFPPSAGEVYHSIAYGGQHPVPTGVKHIGGGGVGIANGTPILHLLAPVSSGPTAPAAGPTQYKDTIGNQHKSVVYQPSTASHHQQQQQLLQPEAQYRQRPKQSKINLTPFTSSNTVPGHFIPIIYTPLSPTKEDSIHYNSNIAAAAADEHQQQHQQQQQQQQQQQIVHHSTQYALPPSASSSIGQQPHHPVQQQQHQLQFLTVTPSSATAAAIHPTSSPIYRVINEPSETLLASSQPQQQQHKQLQQQPLNSLKQQQQQLRHHTQQQQQPIYAPHFQPPTPENFFDNDQYLNADNMTPQQKYVLYLQQRLRYNKQQQKLRERTKERQRERQQFYKQEHQQQLQPEQLQAQVYVISSTASPVEEVGGGRLFEMQQTSQQQHSYKHQQQLTNYPQHSPILHAVYPRPELAVPANHQSHPQQQQQQQRLHISALRPAAAVDEQQQQARIQAGPQQQQHPRTQNVQQQNNFVEQYQKNGSPVPTQYIDYLIEEPKQSLDDEQNHYRQYLQQQPQHQPTHASSPQSAFIIITTASPFPLEPPTRGPHISTPRPFYKNQPTLRLQPIKQQQQQHHVNSPIPNYSTRHPTQAPDHQPSVTPQYVYVTNQPAHYSTSLHPTSTPSKLRPSYDYDVPHVVQPAKRPPPTQATPTKGPLKHVEHYRPPMTQAPPTPRYQQPAATHKQHFEQQPEVADPNQLPDIRSSSLAEILHKLQASNHLPQTLTPDNIDNSIKTLITILNNLKQSQTIDANPSQHHEKPHTATAPDYDYTTGSEENSGGEQDLSVLTPVGPTKRPGPNTGRPGVDYPNYAEIPKTAFDCGEQRYKGFFGDPETNCQVWHYCDLNGGKASFLCPNGTIFSQIALTCDWWFNVKCSTTSQLYVLNERLYKYILPFNPKFPEDYSGPIVDKYLALKFQEMEEKMRQEKEKKAAATAASAEEEHSTDAESHVEVETTTTTTVSSQAQEHHSINSLVGEQSSERNLLIDDEVDDISQRDTVNAAYASSSSSTSSTSTTREAELPLSLKPIVVSSTSEPDFDRSSEEQEVQAKQMQSMLGSSMEYTDQQNSVPHKAPQRETTKISVEKVEVIEIKSDGSSGHLTSAMIFNAEEKSR